MSAAVDLLVIVLSHGGGGEEDGDDGDCGVKDDDAAARCFPLSDVKVGVARVMWLFAPRHPPASTQWRRHMCRSHKGWSRTVLHRVRPGLAQDLSVEFRGIGEFCVAIRVVVGCAEGGVTGREDGGDDEAKRDAGGDNVGSTHAKKLQGVPSVCFL